MRREKFARVLFLSVAVVFVGASGCNGDKPTPASRPEIAAADTGVDSGCVYGAPLVKVLINLQPMGDRCVPEVTPASVCVSRGGVVRFKIYNGCAALGSSDRAAVEIKVQKFKGFPGPSAEGAPPLFQDCPLEVKQIDNKATHVVHCDVVGDAAYGFYKYALMGLIDHLDPDVEVRPGR